MSTTNASIEFASVLSKSDQASTENVTRPTIFDIFAQENMNDLLRPAFNHALKWAASSTRVPFLSRLRRYSNELYLAAHSLIEFAYLHEYDALFSEYFYGLKRIELTRSKRILSLIASVVLPYLKAKLDDFYEELEKNLELSQLGVPQAQMSGSTCFGSSLKRFVETTKRLVLKYYQYFHLFWSLGFWFYKIRFMINKSEVHSPIFRVLGLKLVYDVNRYALIGKQSLIKKLLALINYCFSNVLFFVQFVKWFYEYRQNRSYGGDQLIASEVDPQQDLIPPPQLDETLAQNKAYQTLTQRGLCPLCNRKRTNQCALSVSGFVFCYPCIFRYVKENNRCPLTNFPCSTKNIVRIYSANS